MTDVAYSALSSLMALASSQCPWCDEPIVGGEAVAFVSPTPRHSIRACLACGWAAFNDQLATRYKGRHR